MDSSIQKQPEVDEIKIGFAEKTVCVSFENILPVKPLTDALLRSVKYKQIVTSIRSVGVIEPLVVIRESARSKKYILLDGHLRLSALKETGENRTTCLISNDDEAFTYNKYINRLSIIQEHKMIRRAVERGVSEEKIAQALGVDVSNIVKKRYLLKGICPEAAELLQDKMAPGGVFSILKKMTPMRQIQVATLMNDANIYSIAYTRALWVATPKDELTNPEKPKKLRGLSDEQVGRMEVEMVHLDREYQLVEDNYSTDVLNLTLAKGYLTKLLGSAEVVKYLAKNHAEILGHFQSLSELASLDGVRIINTNSID